MMNKKGPFEVFVAKKAYFNFEVHKLYQSYGRTNFNKSWRSCDDF